MKYTQKILHKLSDTYRQFRLRRAFSLSDQILFAQRLSLLMDSGVSAVEALGTLKNMDTSPYRKKIYEILLLDGEHGVPLWKSIRGTRIVFEDTLVTMIRNGESSGSLALSLSHAHHYLEKRNDIKKKMTGSLIYPLFIAVATICMALFLILYIFPKIIPLLKSLNIQLPLITRIVQAFYYFAVSYGVWSVLGCVACVGVFVFLIKKYTRIRYTTDACLLKLPYVGAYIKMYIISSVLARGHMLLSSGKSVPELLIFSEESLKNLVYKKAFGEMGEKCTRGVSLSTSLKKYPHLFSSLFIDMCSIGERTGNLSVILAHCSRIFEQDIENTLKKVSSLLEPILMIFMGLIVGSIALSIILPVYEVTNHLTK